MEGQRSRLPIFLGIHKRGIAQQKAEEEEEDKKRRDKEDREFWKNKGMVDHNLENSQYSDHETDSDSGGGKKNHTNRKYTMKTRKNKKSKKRWSLKYKRSINCKRPRGFSQRQYCNYGRKKSYRK
jgi:hypothetical protein